jgi:hypothetical protein
MVRGSTTPRGQLLFKGPDESFSDAKKGPKIAQTKIGGGPNSPPKKSRKFPKKVPKKVPKIPEKRQKS